MPEKTATEARQAINARAWEWDKTHTKQYKVKLNMNTDADIIAYLESIDNVQGFLKQLIRDEMASHVQEQRPEIIPD